MLESLAKRARPPTPPLPPSPTPPPLENKGVIETDLVLAGTLRAIALFYPLNTSR